MNLEIEPLDSIIRVYATKTMKMQLKKFAKKHKVSAGQIARRALHLYLFTNEEK